MTGEDLGELAAGRLPDPLRPDRRRPAPDFYVVADLPGIFTVDLVGDFLVAVDRVAAATGKDRAGVVRRWLEAGLLGDGDLIGETGGP